MTTNDILELLSDDILSHGLLAQCLEQSAASSVPLDERIRQVLTGLLASGKVEIGAAETTTTEHVDFAAWKGTVHARVSRAMAAVDAAEGSDREFAYWLCLRENVDRYEGE